MKPMILIAAVAALMLPGPYAGLIAADKADLPPRSTALRAEPSTQTIQAKPGEKLIHATFKVTNAGAREIELGGTSTTCGCSVSSISPKRLKPGEVAIVSVEGEPPRVGTKRVEIFVESTKKDTPELTLEMFMIGAGTVPYVAFHSFAIPFGTVTPGDLPARKDVMVMTREAAKSPPWVGRVIPSVPWLSIEPGKVEERDAGNNVVARTYHYQATLARDLPEGVSRAQVAFKGDSEETPILELAVAVERLAAVTVEPRSLFLSLVPGEPPAPIRVTLAADGLGIDLSSAEALDGPPGVRIRRLSAQAPQAVFEVVVDPSTLGTRETLRFSTRAKDCPEVSLPLVTHRPSGKAAVK